MRVNHSLEVLSNLKQVVNDSTINDIQILVGKEKKTFYASSFLLATRSPVFKKMIFHSNSKKKLKQLDFPEINSNAFPSFLEYLNTGELELTGQVRIKIKN